MLQNFIKFGKALIEITNNLYIEFRTKITNIIIKKLKHHLKDVHKPRCGVSAAGCRGEGSSEVYSTPRILCSYLRAKK